MKYTSDPCDLSNNTCAIDAKLKDERVKCSNDADDVKQCADDLTYRDAGSHKCFTWDGNDCYRKEWSSFTYTEE